MATELGKLFNATLPANNESAMLMFQNSKWRPLKIWDANFHENGSLNHLTFSLIK